MDEVPVTFDKPSNFTLEQKGTSDVPIVTTGSEKKVDSQSYCVTADGEIFQFTLSSKKRKISERKSKIAA
jgi:hypothetical protein